MTVGEVSTRYLAPNIGTKNPSSRGSELNLNELFAIVWGRWNVVLGTIVLLTGAMVLIALQLPEKYSSSAELLINPLKQALVDMEALDTSQSSNSAFVDSQVSILRSRDLTSRVIDELGLLNDPEFNPDLKNSGGLRAWLGLAGASKADQNLSGLALEQRQRILAIDMLLENTRVNRHELSFVLSVSATSLSPEKSARIANALADAYLTDQLGWRLDTISRTNTWLDGQLERLRESLSISEQAVEAYRAEHNLLESSGGSLTEQQRSEVSVQLVTARADLAEAEARYEQVRQLLATGSPVDTVAEVLSSDVVTTLRTQQADLARKQAELATRYGHKHPKMINVQAEQRDLDLLIRDEIGRVVSNLNNEVVVIKSRVRSFEKSLTLLGDDVVMDERARIELNNLQREVDANRRLYESLLEGSKKSAVLSDTGSIEMGARKISRASIPLKPSFPNIKLTFLLGLVVSTFVGVGLTFTLEALESGFTNTQQLEEELGLPGFATIPMLNKKTRTFKGHLRTVHGYMMLRPMSVFSESIRALRSSIALSNLDTPPKVIVVTSSLPGEGKTTVSLCLACQSGSVGTRTLVVDTDFRMSALTKTFGAEAKPGLIDLLAGKAKFKEVAYSIKGLSMDFIPRGVGDTNTSEMFNSKTFERFIEMARQRYDLVILDSAPVLPIIDTPVMARKADKTILLTAWQKTPRAAVSDALRRLQDYKVDVAGVILSQVDERRQARRSGNNYYYGKYGNYGQYYTD